MPCGPGWLDCCWCLGSSADQLAGINLFRLHSMPQLKDLPPQLLDERTYSATLAGQSLTAQIEVFLWVVVVISVGLIVLGSLLLSRSAPRRA